MPVPITVFLPVPDDAIGLVRAEFHTEPPPWLSGAVAVDESHWCARLALNGPDGIVCRVGPARREATSLWRYLTWEPPDDPPGPTLTPIFGGEIGLHAAGSVLVLTGTCCAADGTSEAAETVARAANRLGTALLGHVARHARVTGSAAVADVP